MASGDLPDAISHGDNAKSEGKGYGELADGSRARGHSTYNNGSAADKHQAKSADELGDRFFHDEDPQKGASMMPELALRE
jgi:hypothetical protein